MKTYVSKRTKFTKNSILISTLYAETFKKKIFHFNFCILLSNNASKRKNTKNNFFTSCLILIA